MKQYKQKGLNFKEFKKYFFNNIYLDLLKLKYKQAKSKYNQPGKANKYFGG